MGASSGRHTDWSHRITLTPTAENVSTARDFVRAHLLEHDLLLDRVDDLQLVVSELATNAVRHAETLFTVLLSRSSTFITLTVSDGTAPWPVLGTPTKSDCEGRGVMIVDDCSDAWGVTEEPPNAKAVWASFRVPEGRERPQGPPGREVSRTVAVPLSRLSDELQLARSGFFAARNAGQRDRATHAQRQLVAALTAYVDVLHTRCLPVPYLLRDELRIYRQTLGS